MLENPTLQNVFKIVCQIGHENKEDKLNFTSSTVQVDSGLKQGYSEQEIVKGVHAKM